jgi:hypothetical protein
MIGNTLYAIGWGIYLLVILTLILYNRFFNMPNVKRLIRERRLTPDDVLLFRLELYGPCLQAWTIEDKANIEQVLKGLNETNVKSPITDFWVNGRMVIVLRDGAEVCLDLVWNRHGEPIFLDTDYAMASPKLRACIAEITKTSR